MKKKAKEVRRPNVVTGRNRCSYKQTCRGGGGACGYTLKSLAPVAFIWSQDASEIIAKIGPMKKEKQ